MSCADILQQSQRHPCARISERLTVRTIAIVNQKGGCGKTTTAINLAAVCAGKGLRTLVVDMDPQSHCAAGLGVPDDALAYSIADALLADLTRPVRRDALMWEVARNLDLAPSAMPLAGLEAPGGGLHELPDRDLRLAKVLRSLAPHYDRCFIDCPPTIGLLTYNALRASGEAIIPVQTEYFALRGARKQWDTIQNLVESVNHPIACYVLPTIYNDAEQLERDMLDSIRTQFRGRVIPVVIRDHDEIRMAAAYGQPVIEFAPDADAVDDFSALAAWLENHPADPPEIRIEIARSSTVPYLREDDPRPPATTAPTTIKPDHKTQTTREPATKTQAINSRAAEMAARVRELSTNRDRASGGASSPLREIDHHAAETRHADAPNQTTPSNDTDASPRTPEAATDETPPQPEPTKVLRSAVDATIMLRNRRNALVEQKDLPDAARADQANLVRLFGARQTAQGVLFVQPGSPGTQMFLAGEFNNWSPDRTPLHYNRQTGVFELLLPLPAGTYEYRLIVDGSWQTDPYNPRRRRNEFGEDNSYIVVQ